MDSKSLVLSFTAFLALTLRVGASQKLEWTSPSPSAVYVSGDTLLGEWTSSKPVVSPSVSLCTQGSDTDAEDSDVDECGGTIWPTVDQTGDQFSFSLALPSVTLVSDFYLRMKDDFGNINKSPSFTLSPSAGAGQASHEAGSGASPSSNHANDGGDARDGNNLSGSAYADSSVQAPFSDPSASDPSSGPESKRPHTSLGPDATVSNRGSHPTAAASNAGFPSSVPAAGAMGSQVTAVSSPSSLGTSSSSSVGVVPPEFAMASRAALPTAAVAVPLSLVAATLVASLALCLAHRRSLAEQRTRNAHIVGVQRGASILSVRSTVPSIVIAASKSAPAAADPDIEKAIGALYGHGSSPALQAQRRGSVVYLPIAPGYPVPRQDVRRERASLRTYDRAYEHSNGRTYERSYSDYYPSRSPSPRHSYLRSLAEGSLRSLPAHHRRYSARSRGYDDGDDDDASATDAILEGYLSPPLPPPRLPRHDSYRERPRAPPRSHSRHTAPEIDGYDYRREDVYDAVRRAVAASPLARSHRSL